MPYLLDTDVVIDYIKDVGRAAALLESLVGDRVAMSAITFMEAWEGTLASTEPSVGQTKLDQLLIDVRLIPFDRRAALAGAQLRRDLRTRGVRVNARANDVNIAATALAYDLTLVTRNIRDFADTGVQILPYT